VLLGNYYGTPSRCVTLLEGIRRKVEPGTRVFYAPGCAVTGGGRNGFAEALAAAERADAVVLCLGLSPKLEGEEGEVADSDGGGDRLHIHLPGLQQELLEAVCGTGRPVVLVLTQGSPVSIPWALENVPAILSVWYPGEEGGTALADVLFGDASPAGRLPVTVPFSLEDLPPFEDYAMDGRTYRFARKEALFPFGFGLSYTTFRYSDLRLQAGRIGAGEPLELSLEVANTGWRAGDEVVQCYITDADASVQTPVRQLAAFQRVTLQPGERRTVRLAVHPRQMAVVTEDGRFVVEPGVFRLAVGGSQGDSRSLALGAAPCLQAEFEVCGSAVQLPF
jgi:beta-glucosidase